MNYYDIAKIRITSINEKKFGKRKVLFPQLGFIISQKDNGSIIHLPADKIFHEDSLKEVLNREYPKQWHNEYQVYKQNFSNIPDQVCFADSPEISYAAFLAHKNEITFINTSYNEDDRSGVLFIPDNHNLLTEKQKIALNTYLEHLKQFNPCEVGIVATNDQPNIKLMSINDYLTQTKKTQGKTM